MKYVVLPHVLISFHCWFDLYKLQSLHQLCPTRGWTCFNQLSLLVGHVF